MLCICPIIIRHLYHLRRDAVLDKLTHVTIETLDDEISLLPGAIFEDFEYVEFGIFWFAEIGHDICGMTNIYLIVDKILKSLVHLIITSLV